MTADAPRPGSGSGSGRDADDGDGTGDEDAADGPVVPDGTAVLLFDGVCNLCNGLVQFLLPRDRAGRLRFAPLQSDPGRALLARHDLPTASLETVVLVDGDRAYTKSAAAIRVAELLGWPYRLASVGRILPRRVRDWLYDVVAANRYDWFGRQDQCMVPDEDVSDRFLSMTDD